MRTGNDLIISAKKYLGLSYVLGAVVPKDAVNYTGDFDCAELVAKAIYDATGRLYGCDTADVKKASKADAYTGYFDRDAHLLGVKITPEEAARIPGAILIRLGVGASPGHIVFSKGDGGSVEARGTKYGVVEYKLSGRDWDYGILLPFVDYSKGSPVKLEKPLGKLIKLVFPFLIDAAVGVIQAVLKSKGIYNGKIDNQYGPKTQAAVVKFQMISGLTPDGQMITGGDTAKALNINI
jgi:N-acetylmuramoyl-L-alanine amidase